MVATIGYQAPGDVPTR